MRVDKRESLHESFLKALMPWSNENKSCMRVDESWQARVCMRVFSTFLSSSNENKSCMRVDESWQARVYMRVLSTFLSSSNENKSCMRADESWQARVCMRIVLLYLSQTRTGVENWWRLTRYYWLIDLTLFKEGKETRYYMGHANEHQLSSTLIKKYQTQLNWEAQGLMRVWWWEIAHWKDFFHNIVQYNLMKTEIPYIPIVTVIFYSL